LESPALFSAGLSTFAIADFGMPILFRVNTLAVSVTYELVECDRDQSAIGIRYSKIEI